MNIDLLDPSIVFSREVLHLVNDITYFDTNSKENEATKTTVIGRGELCEGDSEKGILKRGVRGATRKRTY